MKTNVAIQKFNFRCLYHFHAIAKSILRWYNQIAFLFQYQRQQRKLKFYTNNNWTFGTFRAASLSPDFNYNNNNYCNNMEYIHHGKILHSKCQSLQLALNELIVPPPIISKLFHFVLFSLSNSNKFRSVTKTKIYFCLITRSFVTQNKPKIL